MDTKTTKNEIDAQRELVRQSLNEIAHDVAIAMGGAGLNDPIYMTVPNTGESYATIATPLDPSDADWSRTTAIVYEMIRKRLGGFRLRSKDPQCAIANTAAMGAADVIAD